MEKVPGIRSGRAQAITSPGPTNQSIDAANPDTRVPPVSDTGSMPGF